MKWALGASFSTLKRYPDLLTGNSSIISAASKEPGPFSCIHVEDGPKKSTADLANSFRYIDFYMCLPL